MRYFSTVCYYQSISTAAKSLYISQPALSAALSDLEKEVGFRLFDRRSKGVIPTDEGRLFLDEVESVLKRYTLLRAKVPVIAKAQNTISVGFRPYAGEAEFLRIYKEFELQNPEIELIVNEMRNMTPWRFLEENQIDFLAGSASRFPEGWEHKYEHQKLGTEEMRLFGHVQNPLTQKERVTIEDLSDVPIAFWEGQRLFMEDYKEVVTRAGGRPRIAASMPQISGILSAVCNNLSIAFLTGDYLDYIPIIKEIPFEAPESFRGKNIPIYLIWKKEIEKYQSKKKLVDYVRSLGEEEF